MSYMKRYYEEHFDECVTYSSLKDAGLSEEDIYELWDEFSSKSWDEFKAT